MPRGLDLVARAVLFDMDGTLVDSTVVVEAVWGEFAARHGLDPAELIPKSHGRQTVDTIREFLPGLAAAEQVALAQRFVAEEVGRTDGIVEIPGAAALLTRLTALEASVAVVTSATRELATVRMAVAGVPVPEVLITPAEIERGKPDPQGYLVAAERLGVPVGDCVVFEDAEAGIAAATASGAHVVVVGEHQSALTVGLDRIPDLREISVSTTADGVRLRTA